MLRAYARNEMLSEDTSCRVYNVHAAKIEIDLSLKTLESPIADDQALSSKAKMHLERLRDAKEGLRQRIYAHSLPRSFSI
jgi:hypothetical protein